MYLSQNFSIKFKENEKLQRKVLNAIAMCLINHNKSSRSLPILPSADITLYRYIRFYIALYTYFYCQCKCRMRPLENNINYFNKIY